METVINIKLPEEILFSLRETEEEFERDLKSIAAVKYFVQKKLSLGQCAQLAQMSEKEFIQYLGKQKISIFKYDSEDELLEDVKSA